MDVDGTLTDGKIYIGAGGEELKAFSVRDGFGINEILLPLGIDTAIITKRKSGIVEIRARELHCKYVYQGVPEKIPVLAKLLEDLGLQPEHIAYIGDDDTDIEAMKYCGLSGCPQDASDNAKAVADFICPRCGGDGAVRDFIEYMMRKGMLT
jgi:3-deoxy-D-manno-octulosonate 8-phosphate phosphatase (KDO 8-P phosphatase)